ncbi:segregation and condensation protein B [Cyanobacterium sp. HL-69]|uniref:SMC-Scp complex subunit ScpB n=1 Tax=Cyanobacterium sp. HL-69 TaxID=2054282 RepID=UPI000CA3B6FD|nr:segregation and condensation protein B [Cyanobacterium sp. HL-69]
MGTEYNNSNLVTQIEAILYLKGKPTTCEEIGELTQAEEEAIESALIKLMSDYAHRPDSALEVVETPAGYALQLRNCCQNLLENLVPADLNTATLRTLAAIALTNPILQSDLITVRGSGAYQHVQELLELGFVRKRPQAEGRSYWLEITDKFHQYFEIDQLPT